jgi:hypothetical protein
MKHKQKDPYGVKRLESKNVRNAIIQKISQDFNLTPIIAEAYFRQISTYFHEHLNVSLTSGQISYEAIASDEPPSKHIALAKKITTKLTLIDLNTDLHVLSESGLAGLRRHRLLRLTREAHDQQATLSYEDLAVLLTTSPATIRRDAQALRKQGYFVMTRGWRQDMGPGLSHKTQILDLYFKDYQFTEIERKSNHSETAVLRYLRHFAQVIQLHTKNFSPGQIRTVTGFSDRLIAEYLDLYRQHQSSERITQLLTPQPTPQKNRSSL